MEKPPQDAFSGGGQQLSSEARIRVLLEEYRSLYGLLTFRLSAMDRRLPVAGGTLGALLASLPAMPDKTCAAFLLGLPVALLWLVLSTVQHARSKEDHLRRIDEIERLINSLAGEELLVFQSQHPNKRRTTAGRTGSTTIRAVTCTAWLLLAGCVYVAHAEPSPPSSLILLAYGAYALTCGLTMGVAAWTLRRYRYERAVPDPGPVSGARFGWAGYGNQDTRHTCRNRY